MFSEILKILPRLDNGDLRKMEQTLTQRFGRIAKKFGKGLGAALMGGGVAGVALGVVEKILNPLKETQEAIDKVMKHGDDVVTNAKQFGTTAGKLFKLQQLGKATGLDPENLDMLIQKFATSVAEAKADPKKDTSVRRFAGDTDMVDGFFTFIQALQKMDKNQQTLVQQEVFGEKQILKMADFLGTDFLDLIQKMNMPSADKFDAPLNKLGELNDIKDILAAKTEAEDIMKKASLVNKDMLFQRDEAERLNLEKENKRIASYQSLATIDATTNRILGMIESGLLKLTDLLVKLTNIGDVVKDLKGSRFLRGILGGKGD